CGFDASHGQHKYPCFDDAWSVWRDDCKAFDMLSVRSQIHASYGGVEAEMNSLGGDEVLPMFENQLRLARPAFDRIERESVSQSSAIGYFEVFSSAQEVMGSSLVPRRNLIATDWPRRICHKIALDPV